MTFRIIVQQAGVLVEVVIFPHDIHPAHDNIYFRVMFQHADKFRMDVTCNSEKAYFPFFPHFEKILDIPFLNTPVIASDTMHMIDIKIIHV